jgi:NADPH-dependent 2,4-dienoyl-CoA reductase/sulfur reductase-like enzyme
MKEAETFFGCDELDVTWVLDAAATGLDTQRQVVKFAEREELAYDGLVIATGRRARPWAGPDLANLAGTYLLRSLDDTAAFAQVITPGARAVIVGAGFIGCEVAATLRGLGLEQVTVVDVAPYPMPALGPEVGARATALHEGNGVHLRLSNSVAEFEGSERVEAVRLADGERIPCDFLLLSLGSLPNTEWLEGSGVELVAGNVVVDEYCLAADHEDIAAAGDIALYPHRGAGAGLCIEHWSCARDMGALAAANLLADPADRQVLDAVPTFWSDQYNVKIKSAGLLKLADRWKVVDEDTDKPSLVVEAYRGGDLVGAITFNKNRTIIDYQRRLETEVLV